MFQVYSQSLSKKRLQIILLGVIIIMYNYISLREVNNYEYNTA